MQAITHDNCSKCTCSFRKLPSLLSRQESHPTGPLRSQTGCFLLGYSVDKGPAVTSLAHMQDNEDALLTAQPSADPPSPGRRTSAQRSRLEERSSFVSGHGLTVPPNNGPSNEPEPDGDSIPSFKLNL